MPPKAELSIINVSQSVVSLGCKVFRINKRCVYDHVVCRGDYQVIFTLLHYFIASALVRLISESREVTRTGARYVHMSKLTTR